MSLFKALSRSKRDEAASSGPKSSQDNLNSRKSSDAAKTPSHVAQGEVCESMPSLFSGMTISSVQETATATGTPSLMDWECAAEPTTLLPATGKSTLQTSSISASPTMTATENVGEHSSLTAKRKKRVQAKRPGYARTANRLVPDEGLNQSDHIEPQTQEGTTPSTSTAATKRLSGTFAKESESEKAMAVPITPSGPTPKEPGAVDCLRELKETDEKYSSSLQSPLYSIGTPTSGENLTEAMNPGVPRPPEEIIANYPVEDNEATNVGLLDGNKPDGKLISKLESTDMKTDSGTSVFSHSHPLENYKTDHTLFEDLGSSHELGDFLQGNRPSCREVRLLDQSVLRQKSEGLPSKGSTEKELEGFEDSPTMCNVEIESSECIEGPANYNVVLEANDKLELLLQHHQSQLLGMSEDKNKLDGLEEDLILSYATESKLQQQKEQELRCLQQEESQALANDSYDLAEEKNACVEQLRKQLEAMKYRLPAQDEKVNAALNLRGELNQREAEYHRTVLTALEELREEQTLHCKKFQDSTAGKLKKERVALNSKRQQLDRVLEHLKVDLEHLMKGETELDEDIGFRISEFRDKKEELLQAETGIQEEIEEMERKLTELRQKKAQFADDIKREDGKIDEVKKEFDPQWKLLAQQRHEIDDRQKLLASEKDELSVAQGTFDKKSAEFQKKQERLEEILSEIHEWIQTSRNTAEQLEGNWERTNEYLKVDHFVVSVTPELLSLRQDRDQYEKILKDLEDSVRQTERHINTLKKRLNEIEAYISELECAKENAKKARNFKEAKRIKEESENLNTEGQETQQTLESLTRDLANSKGLLEKTREENERIRSELGEKEYQVALSNIGAAARTVACLSRQALTYQADALLSALLAAEIASCQHLVLDLCEKHDISKPEFGGVGAEQPKDIDDPDASDAEVQDGRGLQEDAATRENRQRERDELMSLLDEMEGKLEAAVDVEDFDRAYDIQQDISKMEDKISALKQNL